MDRNRWIIFGVIVAVVFGLLFLNKKSNDVSVEGQDPNKVNINPKDGVIGDHIFGTDNKKVVLFEYGDYQCPGCGAAYPKLKAISEHYKDQLSFIFRNFPLTSIHPNALAAASAAEAAGLQDRFWEYHNKLYENQNDWSGSDITERADFFVKYAKEVGLKNIDKFKKDMETPKVSQKIKTDQALGRKAGVQATPTIILNGKTLQTSQFNTQKDLENLIRDAIKESGQVLPEPIVETDGSS